MCAAQKTPLYDVHIASGGKIIEFGGWLLPVQYSGILAEHQAVRTAAGLFDVSHMGEIEITGPEALALIQKLVSNDVARLADGQVQYTPMCYPDGGTVDDLLVYRFDAHRYLLVVNAANTAKDLAWIRQHAANYPDATVTDVSHRTAQLALQGPKAERILQKLTAVDLGSIKYYWFQPDVAVAGINTLVSRTGYTGEDGFELYCDPADAVRLWRALLHAGQEEGLLPAGLGCRDTLRFEACLPLYGHELSPQITPVEAGLGMFVRLEKSSFLGREVLAKQKQNGPARKIVGFVMVERGVPRNGYPIVADGRHIGYVTTGSFAPTLGQNYGLGLVDSEYAAIDQEWAVEIRGKLVKAKVVKKPFYKREGK